MISEYLEPDKKQDNDQSEKKQDTHNDSLTDQKRRTIETKGPVRNKKFKVLHEDGSFADLPDRDVPGTGALDGTVGLGT